MVHITVKPPRNFYCSKKNKVYQQSVFSEEDIKKILNITFFCKLFDKAPKNVALGFINFNLKNKVWEKCLKKNGVSNASV